MSDQICPGSCNARYRRDFRVYEQNLRVYAQAMNDWHAGAEMPCPIEPLAPKGSPWHGSPIWCGRCTAARRQELAELDDLASIYAARSDGHREQATEGRVSGSHEPPSLSPVVEDLDELESWLRSWRAAHSGQDTPARHGYLATSITTGANWLLARAEIILARPEVAEDFGREIRQWHNRLAEASKTSITVRRKPLRCPGCSEFRLEHRDGDDSVRCANADCARVLRLGEYEALVEKAVVMAKSA